MKRVFIVHGWQGSPQENWFPWLKERLEGQGIKVSVPQMPNPDNPEMEEWLGELGKAVGKSDRDTYFVGHSLGCITILRFIELLMNRNEEAGGVVLVAGFTDNLGYPELSNFFKAPIDWDRIKTHCRKFALIASDNDPYVDPKYIDILGEELNARKLIQPKMGHFNMVELHVALNELLKLMA